MSAGGGPSRSSENLPPAAACLAWSLAALGDFDSAFDWLETAVRERDSVMVIFHIYTEFLVPELTRDPRFGALLDRLGLPR